MAHGVIFLMSERYLENHIRKNLCLKYNKLPLQKQPIFWIFFIFFLFIARPILIGKKDMDSIK